MSVVAQPSTPIDFEAHRAKRDHELGAKTLGFEVMDISPDYAALVLAKEGYVPPCKTTLDYADTMNAGAWLYNAQPILFDRDGALLDGRKRLAACVRSGTDFRTLVVRGVARDVVHTLDQHRRRSYSCVLEARGIQHAGTVIRTMAKLIRIARGTFGKASTPISWARYDQVLDLNPGILTAVEMSEKARGCPLHSTARPIVAYMAMRAGIPALAERLFEQLGDHDDLRRGHPSKELALQLAHDRARGLKPDVDEMIVMGIQALEDLRANRERETPFGWARDYGDCAMKPDGTPVSRTGLMELAPHNLGMPMLEGYRHIDMGTEVQDATSAMVSALRRTAAQDLAKTDLRTVMLTPEVAQNWLDRFNTRNRKIQKAQVSAIARDIRGGNWMLNAQPIAFSGDPWADEAILLNGQHRLAAVVKADVPIEVMIATGLDEAAFATFDTHARHSHRRFVAKGDERVLAAAAKLQWRVDNGLAALDRASPSAMEIQETIEHHPELMDAFPISRKKEMQEIGPSGILTFFIAFISKQDSQVAELFLSQLMDGEGLRRGNPLIRARAQLIGRRGALTRRTVLSLLLESWEEFRAHVEVHGFEQVANIERLAAS